MKKFFAFLSLLSVLSGCDVFSGPPGLVKGGTLDVTFNGDGSLEKPFNTDEATANALVVQPDGKIVIGGNRLSGGNSGFPQPTLLRLNANGIPDTGFGTKGTGAEYGFWNVNSHTSINALALKTNGDIVAGGYSNSVGTVALYSAAGTLQVATDLSIPSQTTARVEDVLVLPDGSLAACGWVLATGQGIRPFLATLTSAGSLHNVYTFNVAAGATYCNKMALQSDGKFVLAGITNTGGSDFSLVVLRSDASGNLDTSFGSNLDGKNIFAPPTGSQLIASALKILSDGSILVGGHEKISSSSNVFAILKLSNTGALQNFGGSSNGVRTPIGDTAEIHALGVQPDGKIIGVGRTIASSTQSLTLVRYLSDGQIDTSFGLAETGITQYTEVPNGNAFALQPDGKFLAAGNNFGILRLLVGN